eukprot:TRINITY_DN41336_c0_g1_i9.p2 TRINITY_DN41336_c0_g1~~TRINITY_DN41336_c0_g1_i9.p2  ORF type:complete len:118 (+),score=7.14 TRINITY_DN41336_c0_g1_i9:32-385(+)
MSEVFGVFFVGQSFPITNQHFTQVDPTHWVLDVASTVTTDLEKLKEVTLFLLQPNVMDQQLGLGLYVRGQNQDWQYRGYVSTQHPSEVMPLQVIAKTVVSSGAAINKLTPSLNWNFS